MKCDEYINDVKTLRRVVDEAVSEFAENTGALVKTIHLRMRVSPGQHGLNDTVFVDGMSFEFEG